MADGPLDQFVREVAYRFAEANGHMESIRKVLIDYLRLGASQGYSQAELIDLLGVSTPSVLDRARYSEQDQESVMQLLASVEDSEIQK